MKENISFISCQIVYHVFLLLKLNLIWKLIFYLFDNHIGDVKEVTMEWSYRSSNGVMVRQHQWNVVYNTQPNRESIIEDLMTAVAGW